MSASILANAADERLAIRRVVDFYDGLDRADGEACAACFADGGVWEREHGALVGPEAIARAVAERPAARRTVHTVSNFRFEPQADDRAVLRFTLVAYEGHAADAAVAPVARLAGIRAVVDELERTGSGWTIRRRTSTPLMRGAPA